MQGAPLKLCFLLLKGLPPDEKRLALRSDVLRRGNALVLQQEKQSTSCPQDSYLLKVTLTQWKLLTRAFWKISHNK